jgi:lipoate-protein ligase A
MRGTWLQTDNFRTHGPEAILPNPGLYAWDPCLRDIPALCGCGYRTPAGAAGSGPAATGRAILHTDELTYSVTAARKSSCWWRRARNYNRIAQALFLAVRDLGLPVEIKEGKSNNNTTPNPVCFEVPSSYEITVNGKKLIGSAQARKKEGVLQHGSLPLTGDLTRICQALVFESETAREEASNRLLTKATTVESVLGRAISWETAAQAFMHAFETQLGLCFEKGKLSESESRRAEELVKEKYDTLRRNAR